MKKIMNVNFFMGVILALAIGLPVIIHILFKIDCNCNMLVSTWSSGEILQYCGTILAAILAILGVYKTLQENRKKNERTEILQVRPYLTSSLKGYASCKEIADELRDSDALMCTYECEGTGGFWLSDISGQRLLFEKFGKCDSVSDYFIFSYKIRNIGLGPAMRMKYRINGKSFVPDCSLPEKEELYLYTMIDKEIITSDSGLIVNVELEYSNILDNVSYKQSESFGVDYVAEEDIYMWNQAFENQLSDQLIVSES